MRANGIARRKSDIADQQCTRYTGELSLRETTDQGLHRKCMMASLAYSPVLTARQLFDARVVWLEGDRICVKKRPNFFGIRVFSHSEKSPKIKIQIPKKYYN